MRIGAPGGHSIKFGGKRIGSAANALPAGFNTVDGQQLDLVIAVHLRGVEQEAEAKSIFIITVAGGLADNAAHHIHNIFLRSCHERCALHDFLKHSLAAAVFFPLECPDRVPFAAYLFPICQLTGIDILDLLCGQSVHLVPRMNEEDKCLSANGRKN